MVNFRPYILFPVAALIVVLLYAFGDTSVKSKSDSQKSDMAASTGHNHDHDGQFEYVLSKAVKSLNQLQLDSLHILKTGVDNAGDIQKAMAYKNLGNFWMRTGNLITAGYYHSLAADANPADRDQRRLAARLLSMAMNGAADSTAKAFAMHQAIHQYEALVSDTTDRLAKIEMAMVYLEGTGETMKGVTLLREVEKVDPDNETVNVTLARFGIISSQFDKAIARLEKVTKLYPNNAEAYLHLAEAYRATGQKEKALRALEQCKALVSETPEAVKQIDQIIKSIKNS